MDKLKDKVTRFVCALSDVYRDEEKRELDAFDKLEVEDDLTEDITAMLLAMVVMCQKLTDFDGDLIDFTHMLNKLVVQHIIEGKENNYDIATAPAVTVELVKHGRWIKPPRHKTHCKCSVCGRYPVRGIPNYCPNCGARMDGDGHA